MAILEAAASSVALLLADARLPSGGHAYSSGLEPALLGGMSSGLVEEFLLVRARTTSLVDASTAVVARHVILKRGSLAPVERAWAARTPSHAMRVASRDLGRGLLRLASRVWPRSGAIAELKETAAPVCRPIVLGAIAAEARVHPVELARLSIYDDLASAVAALLKLEPRDPADGVALVLAGCASVEQHLPSIVTLRSPEDIPAYSTPQAEAWAESHAVTPRRLFRG